MLKENNNQIITFGCRLNAFESQAIKQAVLDSNQKNLIIFNSCAVTNQAEKDLQASVRKARKNNPDAKIIVTGCAAQINPNHYASMPEVDLVLGNQEKTNAKNYQFENQNSDQKIIKNNSAKSPLNNHQSSNHELESSNISINQNHHQDQLFLQTKNNLNLNLSIEQHNKIKVNDIMSVKDTAPQLVSYFDDQTRAFLEIQNGCNHRCTFCIIPYGRGNSRSVGFGEIVKQTRAMVENGHQEIVLTGVDISDYGKDLPIPISLSQMIKKLLKQVPELKRLRLSSVDVAELDHEFFDLLASEDRLTPYLHLSVQSGDDLILKRMKRRHTRKQVIDFCNQARKIRSNITFGADIISGFPTETQEMFENSMSLIEEADLIFTHIFPYSVRLGTPASKMPQLDSKIIKDRASKLRDQGFIQQQKYFKQQLNKEFLVLLEKNNQGKTENFLPVKINDLSFTSSSSLSTTNNKNNFKLVKVVDYNQKELIANFI